MKNPGRLGQSFCQCSSKSGVLFPSLSKSPQPVPLGVACPRMVLQCKNEEHCNTLGSTC